MSGEALLGMCERLVEQALARGADQAEAYAEQGAVLEVDLEKDRVAFTGSGQSRGGSVRVVKDGRVGFAYHTEASDAVAAAERALQNARLAVAKGYSLPAGGRPPSLRDRFDARVADLDADLAVETARRVLGGAKEACPEATVVGGGVSMGVGFEAVASSEGVACHDRSTHVDLAASLVLGESGAAVAHWDHVTQHGLEADPEALGRDAATVLRSLKDPVEADARGRFDVVFRPEAIAELLADLAVHAVTGDDALRGKTLWSDRLGEAVADARLTLADDPLHPQAVGVAPFDGEGLPAQRVPIIEDGVLRTFLFDSWDACLHGRASTHSAVRHGFKGRPQTGSHHIVVEAPETRSFDRLVEEVQDGFLVGSLLGAHTANVTTGEFSVTAPNVWRISGGEVVGPVSEVALSGDLTGLLQRLDGVGNTPKALNGARIPALRFAGLDVAS